jgi:hypothetical protein
LCSRCRGRDEVVHHPRDLVAPFAQRVDGEADDIEAIEEIFAELAIANQVFEIRVGGGDDADVDGDRRRFAERRDFAGLEEAQQFRLQVGAHVADFVEEQRAVDRAANQAELIALGAGEGAAAVAEQLALEQVARHGGAVERHERFLGAVGEFVDRTRQDFLSGAAFAGDQHGDVGARDFLRGESSSRACGP